jgi:hypothetical protein
MDKKIAGLLGAAAALATIGGPNATAVQATPSPAASYRDLLNPVPNAVAALKADDARRANMPADAVELAQITVQVGPHHHHHHHHGYMRPRVRIMPRRHHHHHHHHHHHSSVYIGH